MDKMAELMVLSMKRDVFMDERIAQKKRHPERLSPYMALSRKGRLKNRGRPWPRERPLKKYRKNVTSLVR